MAAPVGNDFWKLRSKHGRDTLFASAPLLWDAAVEYFEWCQANPWVKTEQRKGNIIIPKGFEGDLGDLISSTVEIPTSRPFTLKGLCNYFGCAVNYFSDFKKDIKEKDPTDSKGFSEVITRMEQIMDQQKFEGAAVGAFNANLISRELGLVDRKDVTTDGEKLSGNVIKWGDKEIKV